MPVLPYQRLFAMTRSLLRFLESGKSNYLGPHDFKHLRILCSDLNLKPAESSSLPTTDDIFIRPYPVAEVISGKQVDPLIANDGNLYEAIEVCYLIEAYVARSDGDLLDDGLLDRTGWGRRQMDFENGERLVIMSSQYNWRAGLIFDKMDSVTPHVSPVLLDAAPIQDDTLSYPEVACILSCTLCRLRDRAYHCHRIIPVTVISLSGRSARIVHGYVDVQKDTLRVFKSPILQLGNGDRSQMETLLSWCVGQTIGSTRWETPSL
ncbi:hypothetical protein F4861DRAFT_525044 [Xylaria intraflava]|nr:hypothetical protein F4861DRAFT_525044 [Xylaria intraflava]